MNIPNFTHQHAAHCESGVMSSLMTSHGLKLSEPMAFGLSGGMNFAYLPFVKISGFPLIAYRSMPKSIVKGLAKTLGVKMKLETFSSPEKGQQALNHHLNNQQIVGAQTSVYWLPYFPDEMRFHFNAHNLIIYAKNDDTYLISDPVFDHVVECDSVSLSKSRFAKGMMAPKGLLYYPILVPEKIDFQKLIPKALKKTAKSMLKTPVPIAGLKGMHFLAKHIAKLERKDRRYAKLFLGHIVRMQEEIGTGGAGFRYMYASFLQESAKLLSNSKLNESSNLMNAVGDEFRELALMIAKAIRSKKNQTIDFKEISEKLHSIANQEAEVYKHIINCL